MLESHRNNKWALIIPYSRTVFRISHYFDLDCGCLSVATIISSNLHVPGIRCALPGLGLERSGLSVIKPIVCILSYGRCSIMTKSNRF
jgi:hypothetical protein